MSVGGLEARKRPRHIRKRNAKMETYEEAIRCLNSRKASKEAVTQAGPDRTRGTDDMLKWLDLLDHPVGAVNGINAIHVAGTKGKGSTCAFVAAFLMAHGQRTGYPRKVGVYTSPHMDHVRERIRIDGNPISEGLFTTRFFQIWKKLPKQSTPELDIPRYLQLLTLLSIHVFIEEKVDVAILETHCGGEYDATNIISVPRVTAVTSIGMDHESRLGSTIESITWHKAGIFKQERPAFSVLQDPPVTTELKNRAHEKKVVLEFVGIDRLSSHIDAPALKPKPQRVNCSLAIAVAGSWLGQTGDDNDRLVEEDIACGIRLFSWPGRFQRFQRIPDDGCDWFFDCAHNLLSLPLTGEWFAENQIADSNEITHPPRILIFSHPAERDGQALLKSLAKALHDRQIWMQHLILTTPRSNTLKYSEEVVNRWLATACHISETWKGLDPRTEIFLDPTIEEAVHRAMNIHAHDRKQILVTGNIHLVSGALALLRDDHLV